MSDRNYWNRTLSSRISRRTMLRGAGVGVAGLAGAALVGCGDDGDDDAPTTARTQTPSATGTTAPVQTLEPSLLASRADSAAQAVSGGLYKAFELRDVTSLDPMSTQSFTTAFITRRSYPQLLEFAPGIGGPVASGAVQPQLAESYEFLEPTKLILNLRTDAKWDERSPTSSRRVDAEDVAFTWKRFEAEHNNRKSLAHSITDAAPIISIDAIDDKTVQIETAFPYGPLLGALAYTRWLQITPVESDGGFDPRNEVRGAGPWTMTKYDRSVRMEFRKNPNYWRKDRPFLDGMDMPIITEYAQRLAQFRAGKLDASAVTQQDIVSVWKEIPELELSQGEFGRQAWKLYFDLRPGSPFLDDRVRRAASMMIDRDLIIETFYNLEEKAEAGFPLETRWQGVAVGCGYDAFWVDPKDESAMGPGAKNFAYNIAEAAKLIQASNGSLGLSSKLQYISTPQYGGTFIRVGEVLKGMLEADGVFDIRQTNPDYQTEYLPNVYYAQGDFDGMSWGATTTFPDVTQHLFDYHHSQGARQKVAYLGDPTSVAGQVQSDAMIEKILRSLDFEDTVEQVQTWERKESLRMPAVTVPWPGNAPGYNLNWPWLRNFLSYRDYLEQWEQNAAIHWWVDESLRT